MGIAWAKGQRIGRDVARYVDGRAGRVGRQDAMVELASRDRHDKHSPHYLMIDRAGALYEDPHPGAGDTSRLDKQDVEMVGELAGSTIAR